jgi:hypothetical protein
MQNHGVSGGADISVVAAQTLHALSAPPRWWFLPQRTFPHKELQELVKVASEVDLSGFSEQDFAEVTDKLTQVIDLVEGYFARHVSSKDSGECQRLGDTLRGLREARKWIAQGLSPDPAKRPSDSERLAKAKERAATVLADLLS